MTDQVTTLALGIDSTKVKQADADLDKFGQSAKVAETAATGLEAAAKGATDALGKTGAAAGAAAGAAGGLGAATSKTRENFQKTGEAAKFTAQQSAQLSAQLQDLFVQIQAGGNPLTALIQQGSQLSFVFGGAKNAVDAVLSVFTFGRTAALGIGAAFAGVGIAAFQGAEQSTALQRALLLTGNAAGITEGQFNQLAQSVSAATRTTVGATRETLLALAQSGNLSGAAFERAGQAAQQLARLTGESADEIAKSFGQAAAEPLSFADKLNAKYNILNAETRSYIRTLTEQGREQEALVVVFDALNERLSETARRSAETGGVVSWLKSQFTDAKQQVSEFWRQLQTLGQDSTAEETLSRITAQITELQKAGQTRYVFGPSLSELQQQQAALQELVRLQQRSANASAEKVESDRAALQFQGLIDRAKPRELQAEEAIANARALAAKSGAKPEQIDAVTRALQIQFGVIDRINQRSQIAFDFNVAEARRQLDAISSAYSNAQALLEAGRAAGIVSDQAYYATRRQLIEESTEAQVRNLQTEIAAIRSREIIAKDAAERERLDADRRTQIADREARIAVLRADGSARAQALTIGETAALRQQMRQYQETQIAAELYIEAQRRASSRKVEGFELGDNARQRAAELAGIEERYNARRAQLDSEFAVGRLRGKRDQYEQELALLDRTQAEEQRIYEDSYSALREKQQSFQSGAARGLAQYLEQVQDVAANTEQALGRAFKGAEDALVSFATTGKANFKGLVQSIIADLIRLQVQQSIMKPLAAYFGSFGGGGSVGESVGGSLGGSYGGAGAMGTQVSPGMMYRVNERGPGEMLQASDGSKYLMSNTTGRVVPNDGGGGGGGLAINLYGDASERQIQRMAAVARQVYAEGAAGQARRF